jgi:hypothetical protein
MRIVAVAILLALALAPAAAHANAGIGLLVLAVPITIIALLPAILIEGPVLARILQLPGGRAMWVSCVANIASTILGTLIAVVTSVIPLMYGEFMRETVLISLVPMFLVSWWLEYLVVRRMLPPEKRPRSRRATGVANAITYAAMLIGVAIFVPPESATFNRWRLSPALAELGVARMEVGEHFASHGAFPPPKRFTPTDRSVKSLTLEPGGRIIATLSFPGREVADGRHIVYEPIVLGGKLSDWKCSSDIAPKYLPAACR